MIEQTQKKLISLLSYCQEINNMDSSIILNHVTEKNKIKNIFFSFDIIEYKNIILNKNSEDLLIIKPVKTQPFTGKVPDELKFYLTNIDINDYKKRPFLNKTYEKEITQDEFKKSIEEDEVENLIEKEDINGEIKYFFIEKISENENIKLTFEEWIKKTWIPWSEKNKELDKQSDIYSEFYSLMNDFNKEKEDYNFILSQNYVVLKSKNITNEQIIAPLIQFNLSISLEQNNDIVIRIDYDSFRLNLEPFEKAFQNIELLRNELEVLIENTDGEINPFNDKLDNGIEKEIPFFISKKSIHLNDIKDINSFKEFSEYIKTTNVWSLNIQKKSKIIYSDDIEKFKKKAQKITQDDLSSVICSLTESEYKKEKPNSVTEFYFPLNANEEQKNVIKKLEFEGKGFVAIQGPPGTGKSHTITNIASHYLATGKRVLLSAHRAESLLGVKDKLPPVLSKLTVSMFENSLDAKKELQNTIKFIIEDIKNEDEEALKEDVKNIEKYIQDANNMIKSIHEKIKIISKHNLDTVFFENNNLTVSQIASKISKSDHSWFTDNITLHNIIDFNQNIIFELREARKIIAEDISFIHSSLFNPVFSIEINKLKLLHNNIFEYNRIKENPDLLTINTNSKENNESLQECIETFNEIENFYNNNLNNKFLIKLFSFCFNPLTSEFERNEVFKLFSESKKITTELNKGFFSLINIHEFNYNDEKLIKALEAYSKGNSYFGIFNFFNNRLKKEFNKIRIRGDIPKTPKDYKEVLDFSLNMDKLKNLIKIWNNLFLLLNFDRKITLHNDAISFMRELQLIDLFNENFYLKYKKMLSELTNLFNYKLKPQEICFFKNDYHLLSNSFKNVNKLEEFSKSFHEREALLEKLKYDDNVLSKDFYDILLNLGVDYYDEEYLKKYEKIQDKIKKIKLKENYFKSLIKYSKLIGDSGAKNWEYNLKTKAQISGEDPYTNENWKEAWDSKILEGLLYEIKSKNNFNLNDFTKEIIEIEEIIQQKTIKLIEKKTILSFKEKITPQIASSLNSYLMSSLKIGKDVLGKKSRKHYEIMKQSMAEFFNIIPFFIMPEDKVYEQIPAEFNAFDLVIIDEASQSNVKILPTLLRGNKVLIVGDNKQISPGGWVGKSEQDTNNIIERNLSDFKNDKIFHPEYSIYDITAILNPIDNIMLKEHFRCAEDIIRFCSHNFYNDELISLKQKSNLDFLKTSLVDVFIEDGQKINDMNEKEANYIISEIKNITSNEETKNLTIGVIAMSGIKQSKLIFSKIYNDLGLDIIKNNRIEVGDPRYFQGQERDIIFISLTHSGKTYSTTKIEEQQKVNVAVSRAKEKLYLVRSITTSDINNKDDMRLKLIEYFNNPYIKNIKNDEELCESGFELDVYRRLKSHGYYVKPQVKAGKNRIDLVVYGQNDSKIAIELDGDKYHSYDKFLEDILRQKNLEKVNWKFIRIWASDWYIDRGESAFSKIIETLTKNNINPMTEFFANDEVVKKIIIYDNGDI